MKLQIYYIHSSTVSVAQARFFYYCADIEKFDRPVHGILNYVAIILLIIWLIKVYRIMRVIDPSFKANKVLVFVFSFIPVYQSVYFYSAFKKIIKVGEKQVSLAKKMRRLNVAMFICYLSVWIFYILWISIAFIIAPSFVTSFVFELLIALVGLIVSVLTIIFFHNYLKMERLLISDYHLEPEINETDLIDN